jgi:hypothetical protein
LVVDERRAGVGAEEGAWLVATDLSTLLWRGFAGIETTGRDWSVKRRLSPENQTGAQHFKRMACVCPVFVEVCALLTHILLIKRVWRIAEYRERPPFAGFTLVAG